MTRAYAQILQGSLVGLALSLTACTMQVPSGRPDQQEVLVPVKREQAFIRAQHAAMTLGLQIQNSQETATMFTALRPTGERLTVMVSDLGIGALVSVAGTPPHDVGDLIKAYQAQTLY